jgi:peptidoglycan/xylan/chitin deacetylase (PgdA/CDA1 family)
VISWPAPATALTDAERFGLELLVDLARLVPMEDPAADVVAIEVVEGGARSTDLRSLAASGWGMETGDGVVRVPRSSLAMAADVAGAAAEQSSEARDRHDRVPSAENALVAAGMEREPVVSHAARMLRVAVVRAAGRRAVRLVEPWPGGRRWAAAFTHDLDVVALWPVFAGARWLELARKREARQLLDAGLAAARAAAGDPVLAGLRWLLGLERSLSIHSTWFALCGTPTRRTVAAGDLTYRPESRRARAALGDISSGGHEIGLHGSFATMESASEFRAQRDRLAGIAGQPPHGVRQHFLRMRPGTTQRAMATAGFRYDASYGYPDRNGFRLGVADVVPAWDAEYRRPAGLDEVPLVWMDRALSKYRGVEDPGAWVDDALALAEVCRSLEGLWVGLWHPNLTPALGYPGAPGSYERLARTIATQKPYVATLSQITSWRAARRAVRAERIAPDGSVLASARGSSPSWSQEFSAEPIGLEAASGERRETVQP